MLPGSNIASDLCFQFRGHVSTPSSLLYMTFVMLPCLIFPCLHGSSYFLRLSMPLYIVMHAYIIYRVLNFFFVSYVYSKFYIEEFYD